MAAKVKVNQDGGINFTASESIPSSPKKFRKSHEVAAFYKFIYEHDLRQEAFDIIDDQLQLRKQKSVKKKK